MTFVLDTSLALAFVLKDEATAETDRILDSFGQGAKAAAPALWRWEVGNVLLIAERRKRIIQSDVQRHLALLKKLPIEIDNTACDEAWNNTLQLAAKHKLTCYDAAYLELAMRRGLPLGSLDEELRAAAAVEKIALLPAKM